MLLAFHLCYIFFVKYLKDQKRKRFLKEIASERNLIESEVNKHTSSGYDAENNIKFDPPVYKLRYEAVQRVLIDERWRNSVKKVVDFGCAEFGLFSWLKSLNSIQEIVEVDIDADLLQDNMYKVWPLNADYLKRRPEPLTVNICLGSISDPDPILLNTDVVIAIEIIEHLYPDVLEALPYNIFGFIQPKLAVFTTPNCEFNVVFPDLKKFRHYDHKFEWDREQFESWASNIVSRFPKYSVSFCGIGRAPEGTEKFGHCSQMAIFVRDDCAQAQPGEKLPLKPKNRFSMSNNSQSQQINPTLVKFQAAGDRFQNESHGICTHCSYSKQIFLYETADKGDFSDGSYYKILHEVEYPYDDDPSSPEEKMANEVLYRMHLLGRVFGRFYNEERERSEIPLEELIYAGDDLLITVSELSKILEKTGHQVEKCAVYDHKKILPCVIYEPVMEKDSTPRSGSSIADFDYKCDITEEDWDYPNFQTDFNAREILNEIINGIQMQEDSKVPLKNNCQRLEIIEVLPTQTAEVCEETNIITNVIHPNYNKFKLEETAHFGFNMQNGRVEKPFTKKQNFSKPKTPENLSVVDINDLKQSANNKKDLKASKSAAGVSNIKNNAVKKSQPVASTSSSKKKPKKMKKFEEEEAIIQDVSSITQCLIMNTLNLVSSECNIVNSENNNLSNIGRNYAESSVSEENANDLKGETAEEKENELCENVAETSEAIGTNGNNQNLNLNNRESVGSPESLKKSDTSVQEEENAEVELAIASREALFDPDSEVDLLEDFEIPENDGGESSHGFRRDSQSNVVLIGLNFVDGVLDTSNGPPTNNPPFPNWLLQLLGSDIIEEDGQHDEPHFYCQGDGVGVHPSIIEVDLDDETTTESEHSNDSAEPDTTASELDVSSLPDDDSSNQNDDSNDQSAALASPAATNQNDNSGNERNEGVANNDSNDEFYDSVDDNGTNAV